MSTVQLKTQPPVSPVRARETTPETPAVVAVTPEAAPKRKRPLVVAAIAGLVLIGAFGGRALLAQGRETTDDAQIEADVVAVAPQIGGRVSKVLVKENQHVKAGEPILEIDEQELSARLDEARAQLATASAELRSAKAQEQIVSASAEGGLHTAKAQVSGSALGVSSADSQIDAAQASVSRAQVDAERAKLELERSQALFQSGSIPKEQLDNSKLAAESANAALTLSKAGLSAAQDSKRVAQSRVSEARGRLAQSAPVDAQMEVAHAATELAAAHLKAAEAKFELAELDVKKTKVVAVADGVVSRLTARPGQLVVQNQPVAELVPVKAYVIANFKETQLAGIAPGRRAEISVDAYPGHPLSGVVESLSGGTGARFSLLPPDNASGNFVKVVQRVPVRIALTSPPADLPLRAGLSAEATVFVR